MTNRTIFLCSAMSCLIILLFCCSPAQKKSVIDDQQIVKIDSLLNKLNVEKQFNGAFFIADEKNTLFQKAYGFADLIEERPLTIQTPFDIASVSKTMTATLVMKLIEDQQLKLDDKLVDFFPNMPYENITIDHLLTHTSGIPFYYDKLIAKHWGVGRPLNTDTIFALYQKHQPELEFAPGEKFNYSNAGYMLLAGIVEKATNKSYDDLLAEYIFIPAKMKNARRDIFLAENTYAKGHQVSIEKGEYVPLEQHEDYATFLDAYFKDSKGPGGICANLEDLWKFSFAISNNLILNEASKKAMFTPGKLSDGSRTNYGKGWQLSSIDGVRYVHHRGGSEGGNCFFYIAPDEGYTYFLVSNAKTPYLSEINQQIRNIITGQPIKSIQKSGFEKLSFLLSSAPESELADAINDMQKQADDYYFALHEFNQLAWKYWQREDYDNGMRIIKLATQAMPDNAGVFEVLAEAYMELGQNELAIENYQKTISMLRADPTKKDKKWAKEWIKDMEKIIADLKKLMSPQ